MKLNVPWYLFAPMVWYYLQNILCCFQNIALMRAENIRQQDLLDMLVFQQIQFFVGMVYGVQGILIECAYPRWMLWTSLAYGVTIITLFLNFYIQAYIKKPKLQVTRFFVYINFSRLLRKFCFICRFSSMLGLHMQYSRWSSSVNFHYGCSMP